MLPAREQRQPPLSRDAGFTLVELLVVVIIVGLLAAIAIPVYLNQRRKAVDSTLRADVRSMALAQETWLTDHPGEPGTVDVTALGAAGFKKSSSQTRLLVALDDSRGGYCIAAHNPGFSGPGSSAYVVYDSLGGGLMNQGRPYGWSGLYPPGSVACIAVNEGEPWTVF